MNKAYSSLDFHVGLRSMQNPASFLIHMSVLDPGGELGIFTDRDQGSIFWGFEFRKSVFFGGGVLVTAALFLGFLNKCSILKCFIFLTVIFGSSFMHQVLQ